MLLLPQCSVSTAKTFFVSSIAYRLFQNLLNFIIKKLLIQRIVFNWCALTHTHTHVLQCIFLTLCPRQADESRGVGMDVPDRCTDDWDSIVNPSK